MNLDNYTPKGELEGFPKEVIAKMLEEQVKQGNPENVEVFENKPWSMKSEGGFDWDYTELGNKWDYVTDKDFDVFFAKYPKSSSAESKYPKVMMVSDDESRWINRVVFMEKGGYFLAWDSAETIEEAEEEYNVVCWIYSQLLHSLF